MSIKMDNKEKLFIRKGLKLKFYMKAMPDWTKLYILNLQPNLPSRD